ncbi:MAG TPA: MmgE/PrpD family protein [Streptosporangiaceae bacterium]|nr:MmgE/PrpD family protein [Streptosporangiaceae bacterium]
MTSTARLLAQWAHDLEPTEADLALADRSLLDTVAVTLAARDHPVTKVAASLSEAGRWATAGHVLDFDDLHMPSTTHVSAVCVPTALAAGGGARGYLAAAGVMARLGTALGWPHYSAGWHATCTAGAPAAAAGAAVTLGLSAGQIATAIALALPAAGGLQRAFGTDAKSLQVGFAVEAGLRAATLAAAGASADDTVLDAWLPLVAAQPCSPDGRKLDLTGPAVPDGLAVKIYPCCYALQRPISALAELAGGAGLDAADIQRIELRTPEATVVPLIHHRPDTGLQAKFSLEYAAAAALLDRYPGFASFTDDAVRRDAARRLAALVETTLVPGGDWLLDGELQVRIHTGNGAVHDAVLEFPPGSPERPPTAAQLSGKLADCLTGLDTDWSAWTWQNAADLLRRFMP